MKKTIESLEIDTCRFPVHPWKLTEKKFSKADYGKTESLFALANGYLGMRANPEEGREAHSHGTFINGFHETWQIKHAEDAYGFAKTGQTIVNVPDAKVMKLYVDDEPLLLANADIDKYERTLDFKTGILSRSLVWRTPSSNRISVKSQRMVSFTNRHLAAMTYEVESIDNEVSIVISSQLLNRQDGEDEYYVPAAALGEGTDPRRANKFDHKVLEPLLSTEINNTILLGYRCTNSRMTLCCGYSHKIECSAQYKSETVLGDNMAKTVISTKLAKGERLSIIKFAAYHTSTGVPVRELADRCCRTISRTSSEGIEKIFDDQSAWLDDYWQKCDIIIGGDEKSQQAVRWNLFQLAQATGRAQECSVPAKGLTSSAYDGHYFWDSEIYIIPFLAYTNPERARKLLRFRYQLLPAARERAREMNQKGALFPWRTINGQEASAYYAAGTAQYHINAAVAFAIKRYMNASGDTAFLEKEGAIILVETARLWEDLGFYSHKNGKKEFHIHRVTGPDEYTTVVNDNFYTNVMARFNLSYAADTLASIAKGNKNAYIDICNETALEPEEIIAWSEAANHMFLPFDNERLIHPQDINFLDLEPWDTSNVPPENYPLLLHYHPLVIYRHQILKQADVVLALFLMSDMFPVEQKKRDFDFYDPITTGDSSLSVCVQSIVASEIGYDKLAFDYFNRALYLDMADIHNNTADGIHIASTGGVWAAIVYGFAGFSDKDGVISFTPRLPSSWNNITFRIMKNGCLNEIKIDKKTCTMTKLERENIP